MIRKGSGWCHKDERGDAWFHGGGSVGGDDGYACSDSAESSNVDRMNSKLLAVGTGWWHGGIYDVASNVCVDNPGGFGQ